MLGHYSTQNVKFMSLGQLQYYIKLLTIHTYNVFLICGIEAQFFLRSRSHVYRRKKL